MSCVLARIAQQMVPSKLVSSDIYFLFRYEKYYFTQNYFTFRSDLLKNLINNPISGFENVNVLLNDSLFISASDFFFKPT